MRSSLSVLLAATFSLACILNCGGGEKNERIEQRVREEVKEKMKKAEQKKGAHDARSAFQMALEEARKWDSDARLYQLEGEKNLKPDGTAMMWTAYFAVQEDPEDTPAREQGQKLVVLMMQQKMIKAESKEAPEEISWTTPCHAFLPDDWMNSREAYSGCLTALKEKHGTEMDGGRVEHLVLHSYAYYTPGGTGWQRKPAWELSADISGTPTSVEIHAVTGEVLEVK